MGMTANMFDRLKSLMDRGGKIDAPAEPERRFIMPQGKIQPAASKPAAAASMPRFKGSRSTDNVHARDIQSRLRLAFGASQPVSDARFFAGRQDPLARIITALEGDAAQDRTND